MQYGNQGTVVAVANDGDLQQRFIAAAAMEDIPNPDSWVQQNRWQLASYDQDDNGLLDAYQYALNGDAMHYKTLGRDPGIISDQMIADIVVALKPEPVEPE